MSFGYGTGPSQGPMVRYQDGQLVPYQPSNANTQQAYDQLYGMTGIPDMKQAYQAYQRGEYLPALGQGAWGAAQAAGLAAPAVGGALRAAGGTRNVLGMLGEVLADEAGTLRIRNPLRAYHSSMHDFDRFDSSKIGSGEGAQMYSHGLYFAESPKVSGQGGQYWEDFLHAYPNTERNAAELLRNVGFDRAKAIESLKNDIKWNTDALGKGRNDPYLRDLTKMRQEQLALMESGEPVGPRTYEVDIHARPERLLDWDKPIAEQSPLIREVMAQNRIPEVLNEYQHSWPGRGDMPVTGRDAYMRLLDRLSPTGPSRLTAPPRVAQALNQEGIAGVRYLDQGSRAAGEGTSNYVIYNDKLIDIRRKYGLLGPVAGAGALALPGEEGGGF